MSNKPTYFIFLTFLLSVWDTVDAANDGSSCSDCYTWCPDYTQGCSVPFFQRFCTKSCKKCADIGKWNQWSTWTDCIGETQIRGRSCIIRDCKGPWKQERPCGKRLGDWDQWEGCSVRCGDGSQKRTRRCLHGVCNQADLSGMRYCVLRPCEGPWSDWSNCPATCGKGLKQRRTRRCFGSNCKHLTEERRCNVECTVYGPWSGWTDCSVACGKGTRERYRKCEGGSCKFSELTKSLGCTLSTCEISCRGIFFGKKCDDGPQDCQWGPWVGSTCAQYGKNDYRIRRTRGKVEARDGGKGCEGPSTMEISCEISSFIASTFLRMLGQQRYPIPKSSTSRSTTASPFDSTRGDENSCFLTHRDEEDNIRMLGNRCARTGNSSGDNTAGVRTRGKRDASNTKKRDLLFLIDESGSIGEENFKLEIEFAKATLGYFCGDQIAMHSTLTRVALVTFDEVIHVQVEFNNNLSLRKMLAKMDQIRYSKLTSGATCLTKTLNFIQTDLFTAAYGARNERNDVDKVVVLITDGCANCDGEKFGALKSVADALLDSEITVFTLLVNSNEANEYCMRKIKDPLTTGSHCFEIFAESWEELTETTTYIKAIEDCQETWEKLSEETCK